MKVAHSVVITPGRSGLYETTHDLVSALRAIGVDSRLVDPDCDNKYGTFSGDMDRDVPVADWDWAVDADVLVSHSGYANTPGAKTNQPIVLCCHGRPYNSLMIENEDGAPIYSFMKQMNENKRLKAVVTFWPEHVDYHQVMFPDKPVHHVQSTVDLIEWTDGPAKYDFKGKGGDFNVVCTETWRQDGGPWMPLNIFALWARKNPGAKLHLYAMPPGKLVGGYAALINRIKDDGNLGETVGWVRKGMKEIYRSADLALVGIDIDTRTVRESMACGCPVLKVGKYGSLNRELKIQNSRKEIRAKAEVMFNPTVSAVQFKDILSAL